MSAPGLPPRMLVALAIAACATAADAVDRETTPFVVAYHCDRDGAIAVAYPAYRDAAHEPIRVSFEGRRYVMYSARSGSGARYVTRNNRLEWWTKGDGGFLAVPGYQPPVLDNCRPI